MEDTHCMYRILFISGNRSDSRASQANDSESGSALVEFSLILPVLLLLLLGVVDLGLAVQKSMIVSEAAHAGTLFATISGPSTKTTDVVAAAQKAASGVQNLNVCAGYWWVCSSGPVQPPASPSCGTSSPPAPTCASGTPVEYAQVLTTVNLSALFGYPGLPASFPLRGSSIVRVQ